MAHAEMATAAMSFAAAAPRTRRTRPTAATAASTSDAPRERMIFPSRERSRAAREGHAARRATTTRAATPLASTSSTSRWRPRPARRHRAARRLAPASATPPSEEDTGGAAAKRSDADEEDHFSLQRAELERLAPLRAALLAAGNDLAKKRAVVDADARVAAFLADDANDAIARVLSNIDSGASSLIKLVTAPTERHSLRTFPAASLRPGSLAFNPDTPRRLSTPPDAFQLRTTRPSEDAYLVKCVVAAGQERVLAPPSSDPVQIANALRPLVKTLRAVETFYDVLGGVIGYQFAALELIHEQFGGPPPSVLEASGAGEKKLLIEEERRPTSSTSTGSAALETRARACLNETLHVPVGPDLRDGGGEFAARAAAWGLEELPKMAEVYPLGGAGDRLGLCDPVTGEARPIHWSPYDRVGVVNADP